MSPTGSAASNHSPALYGRILYNPSLEAQALVRLAEFDVAGCRRLLGSLLEGLDLSRVGQRSAQVVQLLADILHKVNRTVNRSPDREAAYQANRVYLIELLPSSDSADLARERFIPALNRLLAPSLPRCPSGHPLVDRALAYIEQNYHRRIFLSSVARKLNVSPNYLSRLFRRETGTTMTETIQRARLQQALLMLARGQHSISEIAYRVGYQNYRDFYRNFVKHTNASPRQVQRRLAQERLGGQTRQPKQQRASLS